MTRRDFGSIKTRPPRPGYYVVFAWRGRRVERKGGPTAKIARQKLAKAHALLASGVVLEEVLAHVFGDFYGTKLTFRAAVPLYLKYAKPRKKPSTYYADDKRLSAVSQSMWSAKFLADIRTEDLLPWVSTRRADGASGSTVNRDLGIISAVFNWAIRAGFVEANPVRRVEREKEPRGREVFLTARECRCLFDAAPEPLRFLFQAAVHTGMRWGELRTLAWRNVDFDRRVLRVTADKEKTGRGRDVPLTDALHLVLLRLKASRSHPRLDGSDRVFVRADGTPWRKDQPSRLLRGLVADLDGIAPEKRAVLRFHDLRHSAASLMVAGGTPLFDVGEILGHLNAETTKRYAHFAPEAGRAAINRLGDMLAG